MITRDDVTGTVRSDALTIPLEVYRGRCLLCHPLPPESFESAAQENSEVHKEPAGPQPSEYAHATADAAAAAPEDQVQQEGLASTADREGGSYIVDARLETDGDGDKDIVAEVVIGGGGKASMTGPYQLQLIGGALAPSGAKATRKPANNTKERSGAAQTTSHRNQHSRDKATDPSRPSLSRAIVAAASEEEDGDSTPANSGKRKRGGRAAASESATSTSKRRKQSKNKTSAGSFPAQKLKSAIAELSDEKRPTKVAVRSLKILLKQCKIAGSSEDEAKVAKQIIELGGLEAILAAMRAPYLRTSSEILTLSCDVFQYVCYYDNTTVSRHNIHRGIYAALCAKSLKTLFQASNDVRVVQSSIGALQTCVGSTPEIDREIASGGCLDQVVRSMEEHANVPEIQLNACLFLQDLAAEADPDMITNGGLNRIRYCLCAHYDNAAVLTAALGALRNIQHPDDTIVETVDRIVKAMEQHLDDEEIQENCCELLRQYTAFHPSAAMKVEEAQPLLAHVADKFHDTCGVIIEDLLLTTVMPPETDSCLI